jgi:hypothetical protein
MKKNSLLIGIIAIVSVLSCTMVLALESSIQPTGLIRFNAGKAFEGYTLVTSNTSDQA